MYEFEDPESPELLLENIIKNLVAVPEEVEIEVTETSSTTVLSIDVVPDDRGKIIGRGGIIIESMKTIFNAIGGRRNRAIILDIKE
jgi:predicted RNA-binding protein YlqC (UPF0109 family)